MGAFRTVCAVCKAKHRSKRECRGQNQHTEPGRAICTQFAVLNTHIAACCLYFCTHALNQALMSNSFVARQNFAQASVPSLKHINCETLKH
jgi:hypothetical protein